jgi:hypothetical protein
MLRPIPLANAAAIVAAILYVLCALFVAIAPGAFAEVVQSWFHGVQLADMEADGAGVTAGRFLLGVATFVATTWASAAALAALYNRLGGQ